VSPIALVVFVGWCGCVVTRGRGFLAGGAFGSWVFGDGVRGSRFLVPGRGVAVG